MVGENEAEDLAQEVFIKVNQGLPAFRGESSLSTWIYRIATNTALDKLRNRPFRVIRGEDLSVDIDEMSGNGMTAASGASGRSTEQQAIRGEMNACIRGVIDRLPDNYKACIVLSDLEGLKDSEVAAALGLKLQAAKMRLHRARERLKEELSRYCVFYRNEENEFTCDIKNRKDTEEP
jgi:RNA polymerase sigma-70 factor (ECF subfamily)